MKFWITIILLALATFASAKKEDNKNNLNTAANAEYLSPLEKEVVYEINLFRSNPANYAKDYIVPLSENYNNKLLRYPGEDIAIRTHEGISALQECIRELKKAKPIGIVNPDENLTKAARDHQQDQSKSGNTGHTGSDKSDLKERIERYGNWQHRIAENIAYGNSSARQVLIFLLIDDGVKSRGHRNNLLHPAFKTVGIAFGSHPVYDSMCVMDFAGGMIEK